MALVQQTLDLVGGFALPSQRYTSTFRAWVDKAMFVRLLRTIVMLPELSRSTWNQKLGNMHIMIRALTGSGQALTGCAVMFLIILLPWGAYFTEAVAVHV